MDLSVIKICKLLVFIVLTEAGGKINIVICVTLM